MPRVNPDTTISGKAFKESLVYIWKRGEVVLYIGMSRSGFRRVFGSHDYLRDVQENDTIEIYYTPEPFELERYLIKLYQPILNMKGLNTSEDKLTSPENLELKSIIKEMVEDIKSEL